MGADQFSNIGFGKTATEAFSSLREEAAYEHGHGGYSGTIAEKHTFREFKLPTGMTARDFLQKIENWNDDETITGNPNFYTFRNAFKLYDDKWGPALCLQLTPEDIKFWAVKVPKGCKAYIFSGWASS